MAMVHLPGASSSSNLVKAADTYHGKQKIVKISTSFVTKNVQEIVMRDSDVFM